ncbi:MAG: GNAT family N-acetyltransferase [Patescibacteria group bacterium]|nr:GNAT family N-acetyltransferase [Patescibacteria group bacterium]MDD4304145.1 GNAT family N-acetyltransferase [Patescibacteria group bacterium]MDD4695176.1 GNAT family N-acetyltransferase [Patescibacteria group bacterium]
MSIISYKIRELEYSDLDLEKGFFYTLGNLTDSPILDLEKSKKIYDKIKSQGTYIFVAVSDDEQIVGSISLLLEQKFIHGGSIVGHIEDVVTRKGYEGNGIASALLNCAIDFAKENKCYKVILDCKDDLIKFYEKFGFEHFKHKGNCMRIDF